MRGRDGIPLMVVYQLFFPLFLIFSGYWHVFDLDYRDRVFRHVLNLVEEQDWSYSHVPLGETCDVLEELEPRCVCVCMLATRP